jgi:hypothetical protein
VSSSFQPPEPLSADRLAEIREREQAATPGPWGTHYDRGSDRVGYDVAAEITLSEDGLGCRRYIARLDEEPQDEAQTFSDAMFIARSRDDVPALLATLDRLTARVAELESVVERRGARLVTLEIDALHIRGALSPNGRPRRVPMELGETLLPAVEWLLDRVAEFEQAARTQPCGRAMVHPEHTWMSASEAVQWCPGEKAGEPRDH